MKSYNTFLINSQQIKRIVITKQYRNKVYGYYYLCYINFSYFQHCVITLI